MERIGSRLRNVDAFDVVPILLSKMQKKQIPVFKNKLIKEMCDRKENYSELFENIDFEVCDGIVCSTSIEQSLVGLRAMHCIDFKKQGADTKIEVNPMFAEAFLEACNTYLDLITECFVNGMQGRGLE